MTFTTQIKDEITKIYNNTPEDLIAISTYIKFNSSIMKDKISIIIENASVARWIFKLLKENYNIPIHLTVRTIKRFKVRNIYILDINSKLEIIKADIVNTFNNINEGSVEEKIAFLKGTFLSCGSINDPKTNQYHLEFLVKNFKDAKLINKILLSLNFKSKILKREREYMIYIKASENISDFIKYLGATNALFYFEDIRIYKDHKNMVNRLNNCEQANTEKSLKSSKIVIDNINYLKKYDLINLLEDRSKEIIEYKVKYPDTSMDELAKIVSMETNKPITKSGINHHFRKINELVKMHKK
jgi:cell division protein WhiA